MKALKIILIIVGVLVAVMLIVPLFTPATAEVSSEIEIALESSKIFPYVASFEEREVWDPWVASDSTTVVTIESQSGFVGSTYSWDGEKLGTGKMEVISVKENEAIKSSLQFGDMDTPSLVEWSFEPVDGGTHVVWSFSQETTYPIGRLGMIFGKVFLKRSFKTGLTSLKEYLESKPQSLSSLGPITIETQSPFEAMVANGAGTMETIGEQLGNLYGMIMMEVGKQNLQVAGAPFIQYLDYDEAEVVQAIHTGPYEEFTISYDKLDQYIITNGLELTGEAFEFYLSDPGTEPDPAKWITRIAFPLK